jgi:hypothetical protein
MTKNTLEINSNLSSLIKRLKGLQDKETFRNYLLLVAEKRLISNFLEQEKL